MAETGHWPRSAGLLFFQAEDGIRDLTVTGVQTCALPIYIQPDDPQAGAKLVWNYFYNSYLLGDDRNVVALSWIGRHGLDRQIRTEVWQKFYEIGRASCRERV